MERIAVWPGLSAEEAEREEQIKQRVFEKVAERMKDGLAGSTFCAELNPDVIVITAEQSFLFEPQNVRATEWLQRHFGMGILRVRERIRVHPSQRQTVTSQLKAAGFEVSC